MIVQTRKETLNSPFLRLFLLYYGNLSVQLYKISIKQPKSIVTLIWNVLLVCISYYSFYYNNNEFENELRRDDRLEIIFKQKPLFGIVYTVGLKYIFQMSYIFNTAYFIMLSLFNGELVGLLNMFHVDLLDSKRNSKFAFFIAVVFHHIVFIATLLPMMLSMEWGKAKFVQNIFSYFLFYILNVNTNIVFILIHYYKYATLKTLVHLHNGLSANNFSNLNELQYRISKLASINHQLNNLLSFPLVFSILPYVFEIIITLSCIWIHDIKSANVYLLQFVLHATCIAVMERKIQNKLNYISSHLLSFSHEARFFHEISFIDNKSKIQHNETNESRQIRCKEIIYIYQDYFALRLFFMCRIDWLFMSNLALFVLNYIVLVSQTSM